MFKLLLISLPFFLLGCAGPAAQPERVNLSKEFDGEYTLKVQCGVYSVITRSFKVSSGKLSAL
jgi:hypothetical protein